VTLQEFIRRYRIIAVPLALLVGAGAAFGFRMFNSAHQSDGLMGTVQTILRDCGNNAFNPGYVKSKDWDGSSGVVAVGLAVNGSPMDMSEDVRVGHDANGTWHLYTQNGSELCPGYTDAGGQLHKG
jgi:hypothetical protein